nr:hypothetical protein CFP56_60771 [Quercus suber]
MRCRHIPDIDHLPNGHLLQSLVRDDLLVMMRSSHCDRASGMRLEGKRPSDAQHDIRSRDRRLHDYHKKCCSRAASSLRR